MSAQLERLQAAQLSAQADVSGRWAWTDAQETAIDSNNYLLQETNRRIGVLASTSWQKVMSGALTYAGWSQEAGSCYSTLSSISSDLDNWSFGGVLSSTAEATAADAKKVALTGLAIGTPILLAVGALYLFVLSKGMR